ncbi:protein-tyrosine phosphatase family protein [Natrarchaeobaculum aegyptiacum]|uniref:Protein phosphatase n=1 Tax=Natrarchaeobaculum aegyptiacum TaxID=745377 RepID=A0A2Z2HNV4_9EURY|nr:dual specificity protein phosphatase family protein [Natrarchaeobaculum aegyptiacum]ARS88640.1 protein phosphatase [Natrarchaeobaculum aegyptiacum]
MNGANFGRIDAGPVFGAARPGHFGGDVDEWTARLAAHDVSAVCCLLSDREAGRWRLPAAYDDRFETAHVPIRDRHLPDVERLANALAFLERATTNGSRAVIHCNAGLGRTGVVAAAWLVYDRGYGPDRALEAVQTRPWPRTPTEAIRDGNATERELHDLLAAVPSAIETGTDS